MTLFIDTANLEEIKQASLWPFVKGVTTNPSLIAKEGRRQEDVIREITKLIDGPISAEVTAEDYSTMLEQAHDLYAIDKEHIVIKLPMTIDGLRVAKVLKGENIPTNVTLCFSASQALLAMEAGATYVSPFLGRLEDNGQDPYKLIEDIMIIKNNYGYSTKVICASIRNVEHINNCALLGGDICTVPFKVLQRLIKHPLTSQGLESFRLDAAKTSAIKK